LDTSTYCCVPKNFQGIQNKKDNITLFKNYCKKNLSLHNSFDSIINTIISSCDPISKRCYDIKNPITSALLPIPKRPFESRILPPLRDKKEEDTTRISSIIIDEDEQIEENPTEVDGENKQQMEEVTISIWVPEKIISKNENDDDDDDDNIIINENVNRAILKFQSIWFLILISIIKIVFSN